jgi:structure-specific recognition protein 1
VLKFNDGYLFLLRKHLIFLERPAIVTLVEDLDELRIMRAEAGGSSNFDLACKLDGVEYEFLNISKEYLLQVREWLSVVCEEAPAESDDDAGDGEKTKKRNKKEDTTQDMLQDVNSDSDDDDDDDSDEDFKGEESESDEDDDDDEGSESDDSDDDSDDDAGGFNTVAKTESKETKADATGTKRPREEEKKEEKKEDDED